MHGYFASLFSEDFVFSASASSILHFDAESGFEADIVSFELEEPSSYLQFDPHLAMSGNLTKYGFVLNSLAYSDAVSSLDGTTEMEALSGT